MTTVNNVSNSHASTVHVPGPTQGSSTQKLILYFDEINSFHGTQNCDEGIQLSGGTGIFKGRRVYSEISETQSDGATVSIKRFHNKRIC
ncbi:MAG: hypothetical protein IPM96_13595 [Ignavibacteria bacterium]|nr:hypothetical protein [Ignavibacteria bacterium]